LKPTLLYFGPQWAGSTSLQRLRAFERLEGVSTIGVDCGARIGGRASLWQRVRWKLRLPLDVHAENARLIAAVATHRPQIVIVDNSKVIQRETMTRMRQLGARTLVYYSPDDLAARHNLSLPLEWSLPAWDIVCTTKTFNVPELAALGVHHPFLIGKAYDSSLHQPMTATQVGADYERFDAVFLGTYEAARCASINALAKSGVSVVVYGSDKGGWRRDALDPSIELRRSAFGEDYVRAWHVGKVALCFLRKLNRDRITQRTMEIAAIGRPMVAERTEEHDEHFEHATEYLGFSSDEELIQQVRGLLADDRARLRLGEAGRARCLRSGYSTEERAQQMLKVFLSR
jgi:hypothetical protein